MVNVPTDINNSSNSNNFRQTSTFMKNTKKFYNKNPKTASRHFFQHPQHQQSDLSSIDAHGENSGLVVESSAPPAIAVVAPTARNPTCHVPNMPPPCKAGLVHQMPRTMHVQHIHHIQPVQLTAATLSPPPPTQQQQQQSQLAAQPANSVQLSQPPPPQPTQNAAVWPVEPAFHFGPGFEIHQSYCPTHSHQHAEQHIVLFHLLPGVAVSFQIAGGRKIIQGESKLLYLAAFSVRMPRNVRIIHLLARLQDA